METNLKNNLTLSLIFLVLLVVCFLSPYSIFGQDAFKAWMPALTDLAHDHYNAGGVVFGGQNIEGIYGKLPHWSLLSSMGFNSFAILNTTYFIFVFFVFYALNIIFKGMVGESSLAASLIIFIYTILSPIVTNRVFSGHFNILFGLVPFLYWIALLYNQSATTIIIAVLGQWNAFSIQSYQILTYYIFYIPLFYFWYQSARSTQSKKPLVVIAASAAFAFLLNIQSFLQMVGHATSAENVRSHAGILTYSYAVLKWSDVGNLFFSGYNIFTNSRHFGFFHEVNFPLGFSFLSLYFVPKEFKKIAFVLIATFIFCLLFSANTPPFNSLAALPLIKMFRVPQRTLMLPAFLFGFLSLVTFKSLLNVRTLVYLLLFTLAGQIVPLEVYLLFSLVLFVPKKFHKDWYKPAVFSFLAAFSFLGLTERFDQISKGNIEFTIFNDFIQELDQKYKLSGTSKIVHFESPMAVDLTLMANVHNIKTMEGYGHPPYSTLEKVRRLEPGFIPAHGNSIFIDRRSQHFPELIRVLNITDIFYVDKSGRYQHQFAKDL